MTKNEFHSLLKKEAPKLYDYMNIIVDLDGDTGEEAKQELMALLELTKRQGRDEILKKVERSYELSDIRS